MKFVWTILITAALAGPSSLAAQKIAGTRHYFYLSDQRIIALELTDTRKAILNYFNIGDTYELIQAPLIAVLDAQGGIHRGHVFEVEKVEDPADPYKVSDLIKPGEYRGYTVLGKYDLPTPAVKAYFKLGGRIVEFEPVSAENFEWVAARISQLDLTRPDKKEMVLRAGFFRGHGTLHLEGAPGGAELRKYFPDTDLLPPPLLASSQPALPPEFAHLPDPVVVKVRAVVSRSGGLRDIEVREGINPKLNQLAVESVRNSWRFLPAISKGETATAELTLNVVFRRE